MSTEDKRNKLLQRLDALKIFPKNNKLVKQLRKQLQRQLQRIEQQELTTSTDVKHQANLARSRKLKRYHHYIRLIHDNFPDLSIAEIRKQFARRRKQEDVSIPDAVWQNPSP